MGMISNIIFGKKPTLEEADTGGRMIVSMQNMGKHVYAGTVPWKEKARRRNRNRMARMSRRANR